ncbi:hypothetical protein OS493_012305 [Desmophyllum pertusum]|uniref:beta-mannosidase n=1 Tax=Desmophyllum pertusum TaxID=174260 RepID=A0A9W9ZS51_9CNID|nr:hypothetical protein OS493_012305 [Desmophyllum pertusum]
MAIEKQIFSFILAITFSYFNLIRCEVTEVNLGGTWIVTNANKSISVHGNVPGNVHTALYENGTIMDPYFRFNDVKYRWIAYDNWTYTRSLEVPEDVTSKRQILLVFEGLDTIAAILVNSIKVGESTNMFHRYIFNVKGALKTGLNSVQSQCSVASVIATSSEKEQCSFSWDWGPAFVPQGIWRNVSLQAYDSAVIRDITITPTKGSINITWQLSVTAFIDAAEDGVTGTLLLSLPQMSRSQKLPIKLRQGLQKVSLPVMSFTGKDDVKLWWPRGYGKPYLYTVKVVFVSPSGQEQSSISRNMGFRKVNLVQEPIKGAPGLGFHFEVNDLPIFLKGANWIPADAFEDRVTSSVLRNLLQSAVDANMNVVRNWGGGIYQHDEFYNIADELGLLVWEEFMFACAMYPTDEEFLNSVKEEVRYQVSGRLHHHPSIILWSGNNENEAALAENWYNTSSMFNRYANDYVKLYIDTIRKTLEEEDKSRPFLSSSPSNGVDTEREGWVAKKPGSPYWGDVHFYNYTMDCWNRTGPYNSAFMDHRQHHGDGNEQMLDQTKKHFKLSNSSDSLKKFKDTLFIIQVTQAQCMKTETEHYRRLQSELVQGQGRTMGTIYWQLNSIWQAPTWSSLEYGGQWKMLHYFVKDFFAPVIASSYQEGGKFKLYVVSDLMKPITEGAVSLKAWSWSSFTPLYSRNIAFDIDSTVLGEWKLVYAEDLQALVQTSRCESARHCVFTMKPLDQSSGKDLGPTNVFYPSSLSEAVG